MAEALYGAAVRWRMSRGLPGTYINYKVLAGSGWNSGQYWNSHIGGNASVSPAQFPLLDAGGDPTTVGLRTKKAFTSNSTITPTATDPWGYPSIALIATRYLNNSSSNISEIEFYGIPAGCLVDFVFIGHMGGNTGARNTWVMINQNPESRINHQCSKLTASPQSALSGAVCFQGIEPQDGVINVNMQGNPQGTMTAMELRIYRR